MAKIKDPVSGFTHMIGAIGGIVRINIFNYICS